MHGKANILSNLESGRSVGSPKLFFHDPTSGSSHYTGNKRKQSNPDVSNKLVFGDLFFSQSGKEVEGKTEAVLHEKPNDGNTTTTADEQATIVTPTLSEKLLSTMSFEEALSVLNETDIDKIFELYNATASQLLTSGFEDISRPYDVAMRLNKELEQFQTGMDSDLSQLGKRRRESSEAVEKLR